MSLQAFDIELSGNITAVFPHAVAPTSHISALEVCGDFLYLGTKEGYIVKCSFSRELQNLHQKICLKKASHTLMLNAGPILQLKALSALNQLLVLSDESLIVIDLQDVKVIKNLKFKNVTSFYISESPLEDDPFSVELCIAAKKKIYFAKLSNEQCKINKEFSVNATPSSILLDSEVVCFSMGLDYHLLNLYTGEIQELFSRDVEQPPIIHRVSKGEFLLCGPGGLGVFVCGEGFSEKLPIHFTEAVTALTYCHPYIIAVCGNNLHFYSIIDQKSKQVIAISNVRCLINGDGQIFASTAIDIFALHPINTDVQLEKLMKEDRLEEALLLANNVHISSSDLEKHKTILQNLQNQVALKRFAAGQFYEFLEFTSISSVEPEKIISIDLNSTFADENLRREALECLIEFLERSRQSYITRGVSSETVDTVLLEQYVSRDNAGPKLQELVEQCEIKEDKLVSLLQTHKRYHSLAVFFAAKDKLENAFEIWEKLVNENLHDSHFPGPTMVAERLNKSHNPVLVWRFSPAILKRDEVLGASIFLGLCDNQPQTMRERIINFLQDYPHCQKIFLEFLYNRNPEEESTGNQLAGLYIKEITAARNDRITSLHAATINKLRSLLRTSKALNLQRISTLLDDRHFPHEHAIICGRLGNHNDAIRIFIHHLKDFDAAEEYCNCVGDAKAWNELLSSCVRSNDCSMYERIIGLLGRNPEEFDIISALALLPDTASLSAVQPAIKFALRNSLHKRRMKMLEKSFHYVENLSSHYQLINLETQSFGLQTSSYCCICKQQFQLDQGFARYPNGTLTHKHCISNLHICPLTGYLFKISITDS